MRKHPERVVQSHVLQLLRTIGARCYTLGTVRKRGDHPGTMQSPGLPDVIAFLPARAAWPACVLMVECKAPGGRLSAEQQRFRDECRDARIDWVCGGLDDVIEWLIGHGYLRREQVAHYRQPKEHP